MRLLAIDPGNIESAYVIVDEDMRIYEHGKLPNETLRMLITRRPEITNYSIEMIASYGMAVGKEVFETCVWIGRFQETALHVNDHALIEYVYRREEKEHICHDSKANDSTIRRSLIDRFAKHDLKNGKGTKNAPDWFYGFKADEWAAFAVAYTTLIRNPHYAERVKGIESCPF